jgi:hypothetical protein
MTGRRPGDRVVKTFWLVAAVVEIVAGLLVFFGAGWAFVTVAPSRAMELMVPGAVFSLHGVVLLLQTARSS